jgi:hypothetical protein
MQGMEVESSALSGWLTRDISAILTMQVPTGWVSDEEMDMQ